MENFPPSNWDVRHLNDFDDITVPAPTGSKFHFQALLVGRPAKGKEGQYRFLVSGNDHVKFTVNIEDVLEDSLFEGMTVECQMQLGSQVKPNQTNLNKILTHLTLNALNVKLDALDRAGTQLLDIQMGRPGGDGLGPGHRDHRQEPQARHGHLPQEHGAVQEEGGEPRRYGLALGSGQQLGGQQGLPEGAGPALQLGSRQGRRHLAARQHHGDRGGQVPDQLRAVLQHAGTYPHHLQRRSEGYSRGAQEDTPAGLRPHAAADVTPGGDGAAHQGEGEGLLDFPYTREDQDPPGTDLGVGQAGL